MAMNAQTLLLFRRLRKPLRLRFEHLFHQRVNLRERTHRRRQWIKHDSVMHCVLVSA
jgi:hypothetical protein